MNVLLHPLVIADWNDYQARNTRASADYRRLTATGFYDCRLRCGQDFANTTSRAWHEKQCEGAAA